MSNFDHFDKAKSFLFDRSFSFHSSQDSSKKPLGFDRIGSVKKPMESKVRQICSSFEAALSKSKEKRLSNLSNSNKLTNGDSDSNSSILRRVFSSKQFGYPVASMIRLPGTEDKIVVYFTSLRGIRRTYEDCYAVRTILRGFRVPVDERDISMDSAYRKELQSVLGEKTVSLPKVFIRGKYIGGAEEIRQLHETGELVKLLKGFPLRDIGIVCDNCGDARFVPCLNCNGSRKVYCEEEDVMRRCPDCNENGLLRCPNCCS